MICDDGGKMREIKSSLVDNELYEKVCEDINNWTDWKKNAYNEEFAVSTHAKGVALNEGA